jgi:hypothetical protein
MNKQIRKISVLIAISTIAIIAGGGATGQVLITGGGASAWSRQPEITIQPASQTAEVGWAASFSVTAAWGWSYQWLHNGVPIDGQSSSSLTIENVQTNDAGFYSCNVDTGMQIVSSSTGSLYPYLVLDIDPVIVVYAQPIVSSGGSGSCPGAYTGCVCYNLPGGWGWTPYTNTTIYTATDTNRTNTKVEYAGVWGDEGCGKTSVTVPYPAFSPEYLFAIYFTNNVPTNSYPITLTGFNP